MTDRYSQEYQAFLTQLRRARKEAGLTQKEVAKLLGKPQSYVSRSESGERRVDVFELVDFAKLYQKSLQFFIEDS